jgi:UDP:flavonoid glycosyltransferase YjiC (YdhE family)
VRALFTLLPARGSLQPLLPVAEAMQSRGHQIALCSSPRLREEVEARGFRFLPAGLDWHVSDPDYIDVLCQAAGGLAFPQLAGEERFAWVIANLFIGAAARRMLHELIGVARAWSADLIIRESLEFAGCVAAEALGLPHASVAAAADSALDRRRELAGPLTGLRLQAGLPADPEGDMVFRYLHLCFTPPCFDGPGARFPPTARFFAHRSTPAPHDALPPWLDHLAERPTVLVSMGTVFHRTPGLQETILAALRDESFNLLIALGFDQDPSRLGPLPPHVRVRPTLPQAALLPRCALLVSHGGFNSVKEALAEGVPLVILPIAGDQPYCAGRCQALGVARVIGPAERNAGAIRAAVRTVLGDPAYRQHARHMRGEICALPPAEAAVTALEQIVARHARHSEGPADQVGQ